MFLLIIYNNKKTMQNENPTQCRCEEEEDARDKFRSEMREKLELEKSMKYCANLQRFKFKNDWEYELSEFITNLTNTDLENIHNHHCIFDLLESFNVDDDEHKKYMYLNLLNQNDTDKEKMLNDIVTIVST
jgi:hypothetical protein